MWNLELQSACLVAVQQAVSADTCLMTKSLHPKKMQIFVNTVKEKLANCIFLLVLCSLAISAKASEDKHQSGEHVVLT